MVAIMTNRPGPNEEAAEATPQNAPTDAPVEEPENFKAWRAREKGILQYLEDVTKRPGREQETMLKHILSKNRNTEYLRQFGLNGATDVQTFRERVPVSEYSHIYPFVQRIMNGDFSPLLCGEPPVEILKSSGTTSGKGKLFPVTEEDLNLRDTIWNMKSPVVNRALPGLEKGKCLFFYSVIDSTCTPGGTIVQSASTSLIRSKPFRERPFNPAYRFTSPDDVFNSFAAHHEVMYAHLLLALVQWEVVLRMGAVYANGLVRAIRYLEEFWPDVCEDISKGSINENRVKSEHIKKAVQPLLRADPARAAAVHSECSKSWQGILRRLWPNLKVLDTLTTGASAIYLPNLNFYSDNLPAICTNLYACTEGFLGINVQPLKPPEEIAYTLIPTIAYYEFIPVRPRTGVSTALSDQLNEDTGRKTARHCEEILDLTQVELGQEYEILVTTVSGLCRYSIGDILKVVGFYNTTPSFQVVRRKKILMSVSSEKVNESDLHLAVTTAAKLLEPLEMRVHDYTSTADFTQKVGHYVIFWELAKLGSESTSSSCEVPDEVLESCCEIIETTMDDVYREHRRDGYIGPSEICILKAGTFDNLAQYAYSIGTSMLQYKTPRGIEVTNAPVLAILKSGTAQRHQWQGTPDPNWHQPLP